MIIIDCGLRAPMKVLTTAFKPAAHCRKIILSTRKFLRNLPNCRPSLRMSCLRKQKIDIDRPPNGLRSVSHERRSTRVRHRMDATAA